MPKLMKMRHTLVISLGLFFVASLAYAIGPFSVTGLNSSGPVVVTATSVGTAQTSSLTLSNTTAAGAGAQQFSPMLTLSGNGWETTGGSSQAVKMSLQSRPIQGTDVRGAFDILYSFNGAAPAVASTFRDDIFASVLVPHSWYAGQSGWAGYYNSAGDGIGMQNGVVYTMAANGIVFSISSSAAKPQADLSTTSGDSTHRWSEEYVRHIVGGQSAVPGSSPGTGAGTGGTCTVLTHGTDLSGILEIVSGSAPAGSGATICTTALNTAFNNKPVCTISGANAADALLMLTTAVYVDYAAGSTSGWLLKNASAVGISGTLDVAYTCTDSSL